jgi:glyoxylase-like metal-dependent hydrolase (beta-lactamase superfamily II)
VAIAFDRSFTAPYGEAMRLSAAIQRVLAQNPGPFTFTGTGVYIVGAREVAVIDPGPLLPEHLDALRRALSGLKLTHILVTHTHLDHSPAAAVLKQWTGAAIYAFGPHPAADDDGVEDGGDRDFVPDVRVRDGDVIETGGLTFDCIHSPGHASNHMCYALREEKALFTGDHVMGWSTSVVVPPDGDMAAYMASLGKLIARNDRILYPTHGAPIKRPRAFLEGYLAHRLEREMQITICLRKGVCTIPEIVARIYADVDRCLHPAAALTVMAHLMKLKQEGQVKADGASLCEARYCLL